jgi:starch phosphorylase
LAGDHVKAASDLGLNLVGVGIFYHQGYFHQRLSPEGAQVEVYETLRPEELPLLPVLDGEGRPLKVAVDFPGRVVHVGGYRVQVGAVPVFLLTADLPENAPEDRAITARLYAPGLEIRIQQEMILGIAGVRFLRALGLSPQVFHMNEGHSAFLGLERVRELVAEGHPFPLALELARAGALFTTHTPVPAGHDAFPLELIDRYLGGFFEKMGTDREGFFAARPRGEDLGPGLLHVQPGPFHQPPGGRGEPPPRGGLPADVPPPLAWPPFGGGAHRPRDQRGPHLDLPPPPASAATTPRSSAPSG